MIIDDQHSRRCRVQHRCDGLQPGLLLIIHGKIFLCIFYCLNKVISVCAHINSMHSELLGSSRTAVSADDHFNSAFLQLAQRLFHVRGILHLCHRDLRVKKRQNSLCISNTGTVADNGNFVGDLTRLLNGNSKIAE